MNITRKIFAIFSAFMLLIASVGFTLEHHFCVHCQESIESAYFIFPTDVEENHHCSCHNHGENEQRDCCQDHCSFSDAKHIEHYNAEITTIVPSSISDNNLKIAFFAVLNHTVQSTEISLLQKHLEVHNTVNKPPNLIDTHITFCSFLL